MNLAFLEIPENEEAVEKQSKGHTNQLKEAPTE